MTGYGRERLLHSSLATLTHPNDASRMSKGVRHLMDGTISAHHTEHRIIDAFGEVKWVSASTSLVRDADAEPLYRVAQLQDVTERKRFEGQLQRLADHDPLTGLVNRHRFQAELERELTTARRYRTGGAMLVLDLDNFRYVNDSLGHAAGDELIATAGAVLKSRLRASDTLGRIGGDEFGVILPRVDQAEAVGVAEALLEGIREGVVRTDAKGVPGRVTASVGIAIFGERHPSSDPEEVVIEADIARYDAKEAGRDRVSMFDPGHERHSKIEARLTWIERIREALAEERFELAAQPIVPLQSGDDTARYELLVRMRAENGELVPPGTFLYVAERDNLVQEIDRWVVRQAIRRLAAEQEAGHDVCFEINLSGKSISEPELPNLIARELAATGADASRLIFEVTETAAIINVEQARVLAERLREMGCGFALDDFGTGFASFYYLKHLEFDYLKIDGEFIEELASDRTNQLVVRAVVDLARGLGKQTIAEFVSDHESVRLLREFGVDYAQGFYIGKPKLLAETPLDRVPALPVG
jgi:diguanylate cyclase (GGDEF)-like protein/PAS domain S-box-containing protein